MAAATGSRGRIQEIALELFTTRGYEQTSLREIAELAGMTKASLYYHYPSKQDLLVALVQPLVEDWRAVVARARSTPHGPDGVRAALGDFLDAMLRHRGACGLFLHDMPAVVASIEPVITEVMELTTQLHTWLAGPDPSETDCIRAIAATEVLGAALGGAPALAAASPEVLRATLLEAALAVLGQATPSG